MSRTVAGVVKLKDQWQRESSSPPLRLSPPFEANVVLVAKRTCVGRVELAARMAFVIEIVPFEPDPSSAERAKIGVFPVRVVDGLDEQTDLVAIRVI